MSCSVTAMLWLTVGPIIAGLEDGKVRGLNCKTNKSQNLYGAEHMVVSLAQNSRGSGFISGHNDGSVVRFFISDEPGQLSGRLFQHSTAPVALAWPQQGEIVAAGCDRKISFYDQQVTYGFSNESVRFNANLLFRVVKLVCLIIQGMIMNVNS